MDGVLNAQLGEMLEMTKWWMKGLPQVFSDSLAILKEWGMIGLIKGYMSEYVGEVT